MNVDLDRFARHPYARTIQLVPIDTLLRLREYDREAIPSTDLDALTADIARNGITNPLIIMYGLADGRAYLGEGNHRLAAAVRLDLPACPARVLRVQRVGRRGAAVPGAVRFTGHVPADLSPTDIGLTVWDPVRHRARGRALIHSRGLEL